jgi:RNA polymerase sigma-70 factor (ECF subfamily)
MPQVRPGEAVAPKVEADPSEDAAGRVDPLSDPDVALMLRVQADDTEAFRELFGRFAPRVLQYVRRMVAHQARAEELTQDVFVQVFRFRHRYRPESKLATWIFRIATNMCLNELRRPERKLKVDLWDASGPDGEPQEPALPDPEGISPEEGAAARELAVAIEREIQMLPPKQRAALTMARIDGLPYRDIADVLGSTEGAVKALLFRATHALRERLRDHL